MMDRTYSVSVSTRLSRGLLRSIGRMLFHILSKVIITGREHIPNNGSYIIAPNHVSIYDMPFVLAFWPVAPEALGAVEIFTRRGQSTLAKLYSVIPIQRREYDRQPLELIQAAIAAGRPVLIAPEGGRSHSPGLRRGLPGVAYLVSLVNVPVIPVGLIGLTEDYLGKALRGKRSKLEMRIGKPIILPSTAASNIDRRESRQQYTEIIMSSLAALLPLEYQGVYAGAPCGKTRDAETTK